MVEGSTTSAAPVLEKEEINKWVVPTKQAEIASEVDKETVDETDELTESPTTSQPQGETSVRFTYQQFTRNENDGKTYAGLFGNTHF